MEKSTFYIFLFWGNLLTFFTCGQTNASESAEFFASMLQANFTADTDLQKGLVAYYPFSGNFIDASGNGHDALINGGKFVEDRNGNFNNAYLFKGNKNYFPFKGSKIKGPVSTITFWTKSRKKNDDVLILKAMQGNFGMAVRKVDHKFQLEFRIFSKKIFIADKNRYKDPDAFNFIGILCNGRELKFFVNNQLAGILKVDKNLLSSLFPYKLQHNPELYSNVVLDDVRIYSRALSNKELKVLYSVTVPELSYETHIKIAADSAQIYRTVLSDGGSPIISMGVCWNTTGNPDTSDNFTSVAGHLGIYKTTMTNLLPNTKYYVKAYAVNEAGIGYSTEDFEFITLPELDYGTLTDIDGNVYRTVKIGTQTWMAENLKTTRYADGAPIPNGTNMLNDSGKFYYLFLGDTIHREIYGLLYSWQGATNSAPGVASLKGIQGACPTGWHIPSYAEKEALLNYLGGTEAAGGKLKEAGEAHWDAPNESTNETGFTALGSGVKAMEEGLYGIFTDYRNLTYFWTSESYSNNVPGNPIYFAPVLQVNGAGSHYWSPAINYGAPVRCIMDSPNTYVTAPVVTTHPVTEITSVSATAGGTVESDGGQFQTVRGFCWSNAPMPDTTDFVTKEVDDKLDFAGTINNLSANTTYYVRAYGITSAGISYGNEVSFTTSETSVSSTLKEGSESTLLLSEPGTKDVGISFYPNPATSAIYFRNISDSATVTIYDSHGKVIKNGIILNNTINVDSLPNGVYYLKINNNNQTLIKKMVKQ